MPSDRALYSEEVGAASKVISRPDVIVVGAGPSGLLLACELVRHGLGVRIIDQGQGPSQWSKAQVLQTRTLELLEFMGILAQFRERGRPMHALSLYDREMARIFHIGVGELGSTYPFMLSLPQRDIEFLLLMHLTRMGVEVEYQRSLLDLTQNERGVSARVQRLGSDEHDVIDADWLVGCDGAHSAVRSALGLCFCASVYQQQVIQADVRIDWPLQHPDDEVLGLVSEHGYLGAFPLGEQRYRLMAFNTGKAPTLQNFQLLMAACGPEGAQVSDPSWMIEFHVDCRMVSKFRVGRVFLAGDAAHIHSPASGQGMNIGMQDAYNLAWKLALFHKGLGREVFLDSYQAERAPASAALLARLSAASEHPDELLPFHDPMSQVMRNHLLQFIAEIGVVERKVSRNLSLLDAGYRASPVIHQDPVMHDAAEHRAGRPSWLRDHPQYHGGPMPGERAFDGPVLHVGGKQASRLFQLIGEPQHLLLLFTGSVETAAGYSRLVDIGERVCDLYPRQVLVYLVQVDPHPVEPPLHLWQGPMLFDRDGALHSIYDAGGDCLYLIRPDGYISYRSQPAELQNLEEYLRRVFR